MEEVKKVGLIIAHSGFQPDEYRDTKKVLEDAGILVETISDRPGKARTADYKNYPAFETTVDKALEQVDPIDYSGLFVIGGPGALEYLADPDVLPLLCVLLRQMDSFGRPFGAICVSPRILAQCGFLTGRQATGWNEDKETVRLFKEYDINFVDAPVVVDGNIVTANGPSASKEFGQAILKLIQAA